MASRITSELSKNLVFDKTIPRGECRWILRSPLTEMNITHQSSAMMGIPLKKKDSDVSGKSPSKIGTHLKSINVGEEIVTVTDRFLTVSEIAMVKPLDGVSRSPAVSQKTRESLAKLSRFYKEIDDGNGMPKLHKHPHPAHRSGENICDPLSTNNNASIPKKTLSKERTEIAEKIKKIREKVGEIGSDPFLIAVKPTVAKTPDEISLLPSSFRSINIIKPQCSGKSLSVRDIRIDWNNGEPKIIPRLSNIRVSKKTVSWADEKLAKPLETLMGGKTEDRFPAPPEVAMRSESPQSKETRDLPGSHKSTDTGTVPQSRSGPRVPKIILYPAPWRLPTDEAVTFDKHTRVNEPASPEPKERKRWPPTISSDDLMNYLLDLSAGSYRHIR